MHDCDCDTATGRVLPKRVRDAGSLPPPPEPDPVDSLPVSVDISPLPPVAPGASLEYAVTLTNIGAFEKPINLAAALCPSYTERLTLPANGGKTESSSWR